MGQLRARRAELRVACYTAARPTSATPSDTPTWPSRMFRVVGQRLAPCLGAAAGLACGAKLADCDRLAPGGVRVSPAPPTPASVGPTPMMANQFKLPRLPLPALEDTLARYLAAAEAIGTSPAQLEATRALVAESLAAGSALRALHRRLEAADASGADASYVAREWELMYLEGRWPLALNSNPGAVIKSAGDAASTTQVQRAARMVAAHVAFAQLVEAGEIEPDAMRGVPLDMRQYPRMFGATRLPRVGCDVLHKAAAERMRHIVVLRGDAFWEVPVVDSATGTPLSVGALEKALQHVIDSTPASRAPGRFTSGSSPSLAVLTTSERDAWARTRAELEAHSAVNRASLAVVDDALLHLSLDEVDLGTKGGADPAGAQLVAAERLALCGDYRKAPRWMDKSLTLGMSADGVATFHFEHSWGDGICVARSGAETSARVRKNQYGTPAAAEACEPPRRLLWDVPPAVKAAVKRCDTEYSAVCDALDVDILEFNRDGTKFGAPQIKKWGVSPDGVYQAAMALAYHRVSGHMGATYESATQAHFAGGRTETIRPSTGACAAWVRGAIENKPLLEQAALLRASTKRHAVVAREAGEGKGFDRHLFALRKLAERSGEPTPSLFSDPTYTHLAGNELSTSTVNLSHTLNSGFGPVHPEGFGVFYFSSGGKVQFCTTTYRPRAARALGAEIEASLLHIQKVLEAEAEAEAKAKTAAAAA